MKKSVFTLFILLVMAGRVCAKEYRVEVSDSLSVGVSEAYECVAVMAHLAGFQEYNDKSFKPALISKKYDAYFEPYLKNSKVKKSLNYFKKLRLKGFSYDALGTLGTYLTEDCQSYRANREILNEKLDKRCGNPEKILKVVAAFYNETNFDDFYNSNLDMYKENAQVYLDNADDLLLAINSVKDYFKIEDAKVFISSSYINFYNNYGCSYYDGTSLSFEPKYSAGYYESGLLIHELSHPYSNPVAEKVLSNPEIEDFLKKDFKKTKIDSMNQQTYGTMGTYEIELLNRANEACIIQNMYGDADAFLNLTYNKFCRFTELSVVFEILQKYKNGNYSSFMDFAPEFEEEMLEYVRAHKDDPEKTISEPAMNKISLFGKEYKVEYCGEQDYSEYSDIYSLRRFWKIEDPAGELKKMYYTGTNLPYSEYECDVKPGEVYRIENLLSDGAVLIWYFVAPEVDTLRPGSENTYIFWIE